MQFIDTLGLGGVELFCARNCTFFAIHLLLLFCVARMFLFLLRVCYIGQKRGARRPMRRYFTELYREHFSLISASS